MRERYCTHEQKFAEYHDTERTILKRHDEWSFPDLCLKSCKLQGLRHSNPQVCIKNPITLLIHLIQSRQSPHNHLHINYTWLWILKSAWTLGFDGNIWKVVRGELKSRKSRSNHPGGDHKATCPGYEYLARRLCVLFLTLVLPLSSTQIVET